MNFSCVAFCGGGGVEGWGGGHYFISSLSKNYIHNSTRLTDTIKSMKYVSRKNSDVFSVR